MSSCLLLELMGSCSSPEEARMPVQGLCPGLGGQWCTITDRPRESVLSVCVTERWPAGHVRSLYRKIPVGFLSLHTARPVVYCASRVECGIHATGEGFPFVQRGYYTTPPSPPSPPPQLPLHFFLPPFSPWVSSLFL